MSAWPKIAAISLMLATPTKYEAWECRKVWSVVVFGSIPATFKTARQAFDGLLIGCPATLPGNTCGFPAIGCRRCNISNATSFNTTCRPFPPFGDGK